MGEKGGQSGPALPCLLTEVSLKAAMVAPILATEAQAPSPGIASLREPKGKPAAPAQFFIKSNLECSWEYAKVSVK